MGPEKGHYRKLVKCLQSVLSLSYRFNLPVNLNEALELPYNKCTWCAFYRIYNSAKYLPGRQRPVGDSPLFPEEQKFEKCPGSRGKKRKKKVDPFDQVFIWHLLSYTFDPKRVLNCFTVVVGIFLILGNPFIHNKVIVSSNTEKSTWQRRRGGGGRNINRNGF